VKENKSEVKRKIVREREERKEKKEETANQR
jgi:hypothetical protein